jgi:error-prone DNA polymerase
VLGDYRTTGLSLRQHPLAFLREQLAARRIAAAGELARLPDGRRVKVAGLVLMRQRPGTASGITFVTLEDETGLVNLIVRPNIWERDRRAGATSAALLAYGRLQHKDGVTHVLADRLEELTLVPAENMPKSRDFR